MIPMKDCHPALSLHYNSHKGAAQVKLSFLHLQQKRKLLLPLAQNPYVFVPELGVDIILA